MRVCILELLASVLAPFRSKMFHEMFVTFSQSGKTFQVNFEHCSLKCPLHFRWLNTKLLPNSLTSVDYQDFAIFNV